MDWRAAAARWWTSVRFAVTVFLLTRVLLLAVAALNNAFRHVPLTLSGIEVIQSVAFGVFLLILGDDIIERPALPQASREIFGDARNASRMGRETPRRGRR